MPYLRAFSTLGCPDLSLEEVFALAEQRQIAGIELRSLGGTLDLPAYFARRFGTPAELRKHVTGRAASIVALDTSFKVVDATAASREALLEFAPWAEGLGVAWLRVFDGGSTMDGGELADAADTLRWWREVRAKHGWKTDLMVETHDALFTAEALRRFLALIPEVAILWDSHHTWKRGGENPADTWFTLQSRVVHIHVKDSVSRPSSRHPYTYVPPGEGEYPAAELFAALRADHFTGPVCLEWEKLWHPYLPPLDEALAAAQRHAWW